MTNHNPSVLRSALDLTTVRRVVQQIGLALLVFVLFSLWLQLSDASVFGLIASISLGLIILGLVGAGETWIILGLVGRKSTKRKLLIGTALLFLGAALWLGLDHLLDHFREGDPLRAGYLNSRFPHSLRNLFSYNHLLLWSRWIGIIVALLGTGLISIFVFAGTAGRHPLRVTVRTLRSVTYWLALLVGATIALSITGALMQWTPGHGLSVEMLSLILRLTLAIVIDGIVVTFILSILAACTRQADATYDASPGRPEESQPRTVANP